MRIGNGQSIAATPVTAVVRWERTRCQMFYQMFYHKPPDLTWQPAALAGRLCSMDVIATVVDQQVQFTETVTEDSLWKPLDPEDPDLLERIEFRRRLREISCWRTGEFKITIRYLLNKFIRNLQVELDLQMPETSSRRIDQAMTQQGYVRVTNQLEGAIARQYCFDLNAIRELEEEIEHQQTSKEKLVNDQDFEGAVRARDMEFDARDRLDAFVGRSAMRL